MRTIKTPKGLHNRLHHGLWSQFGTKEERKERRRLFKSVRHKLLFHIPLTDEEENFRASRNINEHSLMRFDGEKV